MTVLKAKNNTCTVSCMKAHFLLSTALVLLCACNSPPVVQPDPQAPSSLGVVLPAYKSENGVLSIPPLKLRMRYDVALSTTPTYGPSFDVTASGANTFFIHQVQYDHLSDGITDWAIPKSAAVMLQGDDACKVLSKPATVGMYLPIHTNHLLQCGVFQNKDGDRIIAAVGFSDTFESADHPGSMLLILRKNDALVFSDVVLFPEFNTWMQKEVSSFNRQHPSEELWPPTTPSAKEFYTRASQYVEGIITKPSEEVAKNMNELEAWVNRITLD